MSGHEDSILIRECRGTEEIDACVRLQIAVWSFAPLDAVPRRTFLVAQKIGGQVAGSFDLSRPDAGLAGGPASLVGFALALPGIADGAPYLHSHMLAVDPRHRNRGIGRRLKLWQRSDALARGIGRMEWTFDPLEIKNCYLNLNKLGAVARRYVPDAYGASSSTLQGTMPTDRLYAEWWLESARVESTLAGHSLPNLRIERTIAVPGEIAGWRRSAEHRSRALAAQAEIRARLQDGFKEGLTAVGFHLENGGGVFELGRWMEPATSHRPEQG